MTTLLDRLLVRSYLKAYVGCLVSLLGLYIIVDLFTHIEDFVGSKSFLAALEHIGKYYGVRATEIFDRLCEMIVLLAAMFTIAWMQRSNELLPLLSAGVSTRRVVTPVLVAASLLLLVSVLNQEFLIPRLANALLSDRDDPEGVKDRGVTGTYEPNGVHISGNTAVPREQLIKDFVCLIPFELGSGSQVAILAKEARYVPPDGAKGRRTGGWLLTEANASIDMEGWTNTDLVEPVGSGQYFLYTTETNFEVVTRDRKWFYKASTWNLYRELARSESSHLASMAVVFHSRLTRPILGMILLFLGLSIILRDQNRNVFISAGMCLALCAVFFAAQFGCKQLGDNDIISPALAAWLPVFAFGPLAFVMFDAIHT